VGGGARGGRAVVAGWEGGGKGWVGCVSGERLPVCAKLGDKKKTKSWGVKCKKKKEYPT